MAKKTVAPANEVAAKEVAPAEVQKELFPVEDVVAENKKAIVHDDEIAAIRDSRKRDLPLFVVTHKDSPSWDLLHAAAGFVDVETPLYKEITEALDSGVMWVVAVSEHQAKLAIIDRAYPMKKVSKKDRNYRYLHLLESAAKDAEATK